MGNEQRLRKPSVPVIEALESRILFSADILGGALESPGTADPLATLLDDAAAAIETARIPENKATEGIDIVLVDSMLGGYQHLSDAASEGTHVLLYDGEKESCETVLGRVVEYATAADQSINSLSIMDHGRDGAFKLGDSWIGAGDLSARIDAWHALDAVMKDGANLYLFGCNVARDADVGQVLLDRLAEATGTDVFASNDVTGVGGDWDLEAASTGAEGEIRQGLVTPFDAVALAGYDASLVDYNETGWSGSQVFTDGAISFTLDVAGGGTIDWSYDGSTDTFTISATNGTSSASSITITDNNGGLTVGNIKIESDMGTLSSNVNIGGTLTIDESVHVDSIAVNSGAGTINMVHYSGFGNQDLGTVNIDANVTTLSTDGGVDLANGTDLTITGNVGVISGINSFNNGAAITVNGDLGIMSVSWAWQGTLMVGGDAGTITVDNDFESTGTISIAGTATNLDFNGSMNGAVDVTGNLVSMGVDWTWGGTLTVGGDVGTITVDNDFDSAGTIDITGNATSLNFNDNLDGNITVGGDAGTIACGWTGSGDVTIEGDLDNFTSSNDYTGTLTARAVDGVLTIVDDSFSDTTSYPAGTTVVYQGATDNLSVNDAPVAHDDPGDFSADLLTLTPLSYWRLGDTSGPAADLGSSANGGTYNGGTLGHTGAITGDADTAAYFDGANSDYVEINHSNDYLLDDGTVQLWFNADTAATGDDQSLFSKDSSGYDTGGHLSIYLNGSGNLEARLQSASASYFVTSPAAVTEGEWHHVAFTFGAGGMVLYLDGQVVDSDGYTGGLGTTSGGAGNYEPIAIGAGTKTSGNLSVTPVNEFYTGLIDEVAVFGIPLNAETIKEIYGVGFQHYTIDEDGALNVSTAAGVLINDFDLEGDPLVVSELNGNALIVGTPVILASGARLTLNADGSMVYDPNGQFEYLDVGETATDTFTYTVSDGISATDSATVTITIDGAEDAAVIGGDINGAVTEDGKLSDAGILTITDPDAGEDVFVAQSGAASTNGYGTVDLDAAGNWTYTLDNANPTVQALSGAEILADSFTAVSADGTTQSVTITINGAEDAPVIGGTVTGIVAEDGTLSANGSLTISDVDTSDNPISFPDEVATLGDNGYSLFILSDGTWT